MGKFHDGELAIQKRSGVAAMARRVGMGIHPFIFDAAAEFLTEQSFVVLAASDSQQHVWASLLTGKPGFLQPLSATTLRINQTMKESDPLWRDLVPDSAIGLIAIDFATRHR